MEYSSQENRNLNPVGQSHLTVEQESFTNSGLTNDTGKKSFLVYHHNKYLTISTDKIAFFYIKCDNSLLMCLDRKEYFLNYSLDQLQHLLLPLQFYRLNRQYLVNFNAIKEVEHYFARKLLVTLFVPAAEKLLVSKEKATDFLRWLENR